MGYTNTTSNYHLPQYVADDRPSYLGDWNEAMGIIDTGMQENKNSNASTSTAVTNLTERVNGMDEDVQQALSDAQEAVTGLANVYTKTESDARYERKAEGNDLVVIGDSISLGTGTTNPATDAWPLKFAAARSLTLHNYSQNNAGFQAAGTGSPARNFPQQVQAAIEDPSFDNADVSMVIVAGGVNDNQYVSSVESAVTSTLQAAKTGFPNARVVFIPLLAGKAPLPDLVGGDRSLLIEPLLNGGMAAGVQVIGGAWTWMIGRNSLASDDIHPNTAGSQEFADIINGAVDSGSYYPFYKGGASSPGANVSSLAGIKCVSENGIVTVNGQFQISGNLTANQAIFTLPEWCITEQTQAFTVFYNGEAHLAYKFQGTNNVSIFDAVTKTAEIDCYISAAQWMMGIV